MNKCLGCKDTKCKMLTEYSDDGHEYVYCCECDNIPSDFMCDPCLEYWTWLENGINCPCSWPD